MLSYRINIRKKQRHILIK